MTQPLRIVFFGTPLFSVTVLEELKAAGIIPTLIVTAPDKPRGRHLTLTPPETKVWAQANDIDVLQPLHIDEVTIDELANTPWDLFLVASYGRILPKRLLDIPKHGTLNVHPSLLPKLRGASPIASAILTDERSTGVTIMLIDEELDHGPVVAQALIEVEDWPPKASLLESLLAHEGGRLLAETIPLWVEGDITPEPQDHAKATLSRKLTKDDGLIRLEDDPYENFKKIQALSPVPGTYFLTERGGKQVRVKIADARYENGMLTLTRVIPEGKREMDYADFLRG